MIKLFNEKNALVRENILYFGGHDNNRFEIQVQIDYPLSYPPKESKKRFVWVDKKNNIFAKSTSSKIIGVYN